MANSVIEAIRLGVWDFEPETIDRLDFKETHSLPGSQDKLEVLAERVRRGLPLWHPEDRRSYDDRE